MNEIQKILDDLNLEIGLHDIMIGQLDELDIVELIMAIEGKYNIVIPDIDAEQFMINKTLYDFCYYLHKNHGLMKKEFRENKLKRILKEDVDN